MRTTVWTPQQQNLVHYYLMFGREPNLPIDIEFGVKTPDLVALEIV